MLKCKFLLHNLGDDKYSLSYSREAGQLEHVQIHGWGGIVNNLCSLYLESPLPEADYDRLIEYVGFKPSEQIALSKLEELLQERKQNLKDQPQLPLTEVPPSTDPGDDIPF